MATPFHSVREGKRAGPRVCINYRDFQVLLTAGIAMATYRFDFVGLFDEMLEKGLIDRSACRDLSNRVISQADAAMGQSPRFFSVIGQFVSFMDLIKSLQYFGYKDIALSLYNHRYNGVEVVQHIVLRGKDFQLKLYHTLKQNVDNHSFWDAQHYLRHQIDRTSAALLTEQNPGKRQDLADTMVVFYVLLVQQFNNFEARLQILDNMLAWFPADVDHTHADIVYHSKKAVTMAFSGQAGLAVKEHLTRGQELCQNLTPCFATTLAFHDIIEITSQNNIRFYSSEDLTKLSCEFDLGILRLDGMPKAIKNQWIRTITLYYVMFLLGIRFDFEVLMMQTVAAENLTKAKDLLDSLANIFSDIEIRREMTYMFCRARINQNSHICKSLKYMKRVDELARDGTYFAKERENICRYGEFLKRKATKCEFIKTFLQFVVIMSIITIVSGCVHTNINEITTFFHWLFTVLWFGPID